MTDLPPLLKVEDLAEALGLTVSGARALCRRGEIPASVIGRSYVVRREALLAHLERGERARRRPTPEERDPARILRSLPPPRRQPVKRERGLPNDESF